MNLNECLKQLSYGELSNLSWGNDGNGSIRLDKIPVIVQFINEALLRLHTRFALSKKCLFIELTENRTQYHLSSKHAYTNENSKEEKFIRDTKENPYQDDLIKIMEVYTSTNHRLSLNNHSDYWSLYTPSFDILQVPYPVEGMALSVIYQARHPILDFEKCPEQEINLPFVLEPAMKAYVAYLVYSQINTQEAVANAQKYLVQYNNILQDVVDQDVISNSYSQTNTKFEQGGWI